MPRQSPQHPGQLLWRSLVPFTGGVALAGMLLLLLVLAHAFYCGELLGFLPLSWRSGLEPWLGLPAPADDSVRRWRIQAGVGDVTLYFLTAVSLLLLVLVGRVWLRRTELRPRNRPRRVLALIYLLLGLLPFWSLSLHRQELDTIVLLVDGSLSMNTVEGTAPAVQSRWQSLQAVLLSPTMDAVLEQHVVRLYTVGEVPRLTGTFSARQREAWRAAVLRLRPQEPQSRLGDALRQILDTERPTVVLFLTDGLVTGGPRLQEAATHARSRRVPLVLLGVGQEALPGRVRLRAMRASDQVQAYDMFTCEVDVGAEGYPSGRGPVTARISLWDKEVPQPVAEQIVTLDPQGTQRTVKLRHQPTVVGKRTYQIRMESPAPVSFAERTVQVMPLREIQTLVLEDRPRYETRFLTAIWERQTDPHTTKALYVTRTHFFEMEEADTERKVSFANSTRLDLKPFQVVLLGDLDLQRLTQTDQVALREFVQRQGGSLIVLAGRRFQSATWLNSPLLELLPVERASRPFPVSEATAYQVRWLPRARRHGLLRSLLESGEPALEPLGWVISGWQPKPASEVLALAAPVGASAGMDGTPLLVLGRSGKGRCLVVGTDETWRWRALGGIDWHERFWLHVLRYLTEEPTRQATLQCAQPLPIQPGEPLRVEAQFSGEIGGPESVEHLLAVQWQPFMAGSGQGDTRQVPLQEVAGRPGCYVWEEKSARSGKYLFHLQSPAVKPVPTLEITVAPPPDEQAPSGPDLDGLREAARVAEGHYLHVRDVARVPELLPVQSVAGIGAPIQIPLWNLPLVFLPLLVFLVTEWWQQRWSEEV